jgi:hypothetical protein
MIRATPARMPTALAALTILLSGCGGTDRSLSTAEPTTTSPPGTASRTARPMDAALIPDDSALDPGTYSIPFLFGDDSLRAIIRVPDGYFVHSGGAVIDAGNDIAEPDVYGDLAFWAKVDKIDTDPCFGGTAVPAGTSVNDLVDALVARRHWQTSRPVPTVIDGHHGIYLQSQRPPGLRRCRHERLQMAHTPEGNAWLTSFGFPTIYDTWILNVGGKRIVAGARIAPGHTDHPDELVHMVESARIVGSPNP